jgi:ATP-binding cassette, subfamily B, bacterial
MKKKTKSFKVVWRYLKHDKLELIVYILLVLLTYLPSLLSAIIWGKAIELLVLKNFNGFILYLAAWSGIYILFYSILQMPRDLLYNKLEIKFTSGVSKDLYQKVDRLPAKAFEDIGVGEIVNRIYTDPNRVMDLLSSLIRLASKSLVLVVVFVITFKISFYLGLEIVIFGFIMGFISSKFFPKIKESQSDFKKETDKFVKESTENISGIREIKSLGIKANIENKMNNIIEDMVKQNRKIRLYEITYYCANNLIYFVLQFIILLTCGYFYFKGSIPLSIFIMLESYIWRIDDVVESLSDFGVNFNKVTVSLERIGEILDNELYQDEQFGIVCMDHVKGKIAFENVSFRYREEEKNTLNGLNLTIPPHKKIAIVGRSGNGKSTIFNLLLRYFDPTSGRITLDDVNLNLLTEDTLRNSISIIRQTPFLFNLSIIDNFKLVKDDVSLAKVREVCKSAYIDDYIMSLPDKYDTIIGEGGINLSGGQKQRIAIARTILLNTKVILFDEATSALDNESQEYIKKTIDNLVKDHTIIIVAHRLSTIIDADIINVIDKGKLVASGTHNYLLKNCSVYQNLYNIKE